MSEPLKFPQFKLVDILAAMAAGKARAMTVSERLGYGGAEEGSIIVNMPGYTVVVGPTADGQAAKFQCIDEEGQEFFLVYGGTWYAI